MRRGRRQARTAGRAHGRAFRAGSGSRRFHCRRPHSRRRSRESVERPAQPSSEDIDQASEFMGKARAWSPVLWGWGCGLHSAQKGRSWKPRGRPSSARAATPGGRLRAHGARCQHLCSLGWRGYGGGHQEASWGHKSDLLPAQESRETEASQGKDSEVKRGRQKLVVCKDFQNTADSFWT